MHVVRADELLARLARFRNTDELPGLETKESRARLVEKLLHSEKKLRALSMRKFAGGIDPSRKDFHPLRTIVAHFEAGNRDEAVWLAFLTTHFGQDVGETVRLFYSRFGKGRWDWDTVCQNPGAVSEWMQANHRKITRLKFGNHRKYETNNPQSPIGTSAVICSFVDWVNKRRGGSLYQALRAVVKSGSPEVAFDHLYGSFSVTRFGRTAKFDFLCLLGNLGILRISPPHCYLDGGTGPRNGALRIVTGKAQGRISAQVEDTIRKLVRHLGVPVECMEDALCNWQKRLGARKGVPAKVGYLTTACG